MYKIVFVEQTNVASALLYIQFDNIISLEYNIIIWSARQAYILYIYIYIYIHAVWVVFFTYICTYSCRCVCLPFVFYTHTHINNVQQCVYLRVCCVCMCTFTKTLPFRVDRRIFFPRYGKKKTYNTARLNTCRSYTAAI
jgi:hypothetical protein